VTFAEDAVARVSRATLKRMAQALGFNETQTVHYALAYFKRALAQKGSGEARGSEDDYPPLTEAQFKAIRAHQPAKKPGGVIDSLIG
jgi:DNA-binding MurR/RpiR family transcriptional regulator